jgi:hypothetical protein
VRFWTPRARGDKRGGVCSWTGVCHRGFAHYSSTTPSSTLRPQHHVRYTLGHASAGQWFCPRRPHPGLPQSRADILQVGHASVALTPHCLPLTGGYRCSALPVAYNDHPREEWTHFATAVLQARALAPRCRAMWRLTLLRCRPPMKQRSLLLRISPSNEATSG